MLQALAATAHDLAIGLGFALLAALFIAALVRSNNALKRREQERCHVVEEIVTPAFQWPPRPSPATTNFAADHKTRTRVGL